MMVGRFNTRTYIYILVAVALLLAIFTVPQTGIPSKANDIVKNVLGHKPQEESEEDKPLFNPDKWFYQGDLDDLEQVKFDFDALRHFPPHNYHGPGHETYATFYASRNASMADPYFAAAQQIVYRLLWREKSKTKRHPVTVFVGPYVNETQRQVFTAAGAIVRELALRPFEPVMAGVPARLQDMFSKLEMWRQLDFSKIAYFDCDAIPIENVDEIFDLATEQTCHPDLLPDEDKPFATDICKYGFAGHHETDDTINAGVMILKPEPAMYRRLIRESFNKTGWDTGYLEQALLSKLFHDKGPFPPKAIGPEWNSFPDYREKGITIKILHDKMWAHYFDPESWAVDEWATGWADMKAFYESEEFMHARREDKRRMEADLARLSG